MNLVLVGEIQGKQRRIIASRPEVLLDEVLEYIQELEFPADQGFMGGIVPNLLLDAFIYTWRVSTTVGECTFLLSVILDKETDPKHYEKKAKEIGEALQNNEDFMAEVKKFMESDGMSDLSEVNAQIDNLRNDIRAYSKTLIKGPILFLGLDRAGKTSIIHRYQSGEFLVDGKPTMGTSYTTVEVGDILFRVVDMGGQLKLRYRWWSTLLKPDTLVWVVDVSDKSEKRRAESAREFNKVIEKHFLKSSHDSVLGMTSLLLVLNKIDLVDTFEKENFIDFALLDDNDIPYHLLEASCKTGQNIDEIFNWTREQWKIKNSQVD